MKQFSSTRITRLQESLQSKGLDAALIYDRENLIYFTCATDLEGAVLCVPSSGDAELFCLPWDFTHLCNITGLTRITPYPFPSSSPSHCAAQWLHTHCKPNPKVGFTRYFISLKDYQCLRELVPAFIVEDISLICYEIRAIKCTEEIDLIQQASHFLDIGMQAAVDFVQAGVSEIEVLAEAEYAMQKAGSQGASFRMQVLRHARQMLVHPYATSALLANNEPVVIHLGASLNGYTSKLCRTVFLGNTPYATRNVYHCLRQAQQLAMAAIRPGITCGALYDIVTDYIFTTPFSSFWVLEHIGYGVGIRQSEFFPIIAKGSTVILQENMIIDLLLPTIFQPKIGGPRITDTILITKTGCQYLTTYNRNDIFK